MTRQLNDLSEMAAALFPCCESDSTRPWGWLPVVRRGRMWALRGSAIVGLPLPVSAGIGLSESGVMVPAGGARPDGSQNMVEGMPRSKADIAALRALKAAARTAEEWTLVPGVSAGTVKIPDPEAFVPKSIASDATSSFLSVSPVLIAEVGKALERILGSVSIQLVAAGGSGTALPSWHIFAREVLVEGVPPVFGFEFIPSEFGFRWVGVIAPVDVGGVILDGMESLICEKVPRRKMPKPAKPTAKASQSSQEIANDGPSAGVSWRAEKDPKSLAPFYGVGGEDNPDA